MMSVSFAVRRGGPADADEIAAAHVDSILSIGARHYDPAIVSDWSAHKKGELYLNAMACGESFYVAVETQAGGGEVLGFSSHRIRDDQHRIAVYVRGRVARCGIGSALFQAAEATAIAAGATSIHVAASLAAIEFYNRHGFEEVARGVHTLWSGRHMACATMTKNLAGSR